MSEGAEREKSSSPPFQIAPRVWKVGGYLAVAIAVGLALFFVWMVVSLTYKVVDNYPPAAPAGASPATSGPAVSEQTVFLVFLIGIGAIVTVWCFTAAVFARRDLPKLVDLVKSPLAIRWITITYIVLAVLTLGLVDRLESDHVATLLAAIAGYVLGNQASRTEDRGDGSPPPPAGSEA